MNFTNKSKIVIFLFLKVDLDNRILISSQNSDLQFFDLQYYEAKT